ncbi:MAG TPA: LysM domain-containing protein [Deltaproteobacteria bacterium]|nr:LysM domain-containing protein [Deltaproteobacteria bacterium]
MKDEKNIDIDFSTLKSDSGYDRLRNKKKRFFEKRVTLPIRLPGKKTIGTVIAAVALIFIFVVFSEGDSKLPDADLSGIRVSLEKLTARVEGNNDRVMKELGTLTDKMNQLQWRVDALGKRSGSTNAVSRQAVQRSSDRYYTVRSGDNLTLIAKKYGLTVNELCLLNDTSPRKSIYPGQKLIVRK